MQSLQTAITRTLCSPTRGTTRRPRNHPPPAEPPPRVSWPATVHPPAEPATVHTSSQQQMTPCITSSHPTRSPYRGHFITPPACTARLRSPPDLTTRTRGTRTLSSLTPPAFLLRAPPLPAEPPRRIVVTSSHPAPALADLPRGKPPHLHLPPHLCYNHQKQQNTTPA